MLEYYTKKYKIKPKDFPNSWFANHCSIAFPLFPSLSDEEFEYITDKIKNYNF
jgi:dTDP-4-amino-4,6-dideoxygalactose transaminase